MRKVIFSLLIVVIILGAVGNVLAEDGVVSVNEVERIQVYPSITKVHPPTTHFAIAFPIMLIVVELMYILLRRKPDLIEFILVIITSGAVFLATLTGIYIYLNMQEPTIKEALEIFERHEILGIILSIIFAIILGFRVLYNFVKDERVQSFIRWVYISLLIFSSGLLLYQGFLGGIMVYEYSIGVIYQYPL